MKPLTEKQHRVLAFVGTYCQERGFPPTLREIGEAIHLHNISAVRGHVAALEKKGYIKKDPDKARSIRVVRTPSMLSRVKHKLHEYAQTDKGVIHRVVYGLALATHKDTPFFSHSVGEEFKSALAARGVEHGWAFRDVRIASDHVVLTVEVWPNHSPERVVARIKDSGNALWRRHQEEVSHGRLWAKGYVVTTELEHLDEMVEQFLHQSRTNDPS